MTAKLVKLIVAHKAFVLRMLIGAGLILILVNLKFEGWGFKFESHSIAHRWLDHIDRPLKSERGQVTSRKEVSPMAGKSD